MKDNLDLLVYFGITMVMLAALLIASNLTVIDFIKDMIGWINV